MSRTVGSSTALRAGGFFSSGWVGEEVLYQGLTDRRPTIDDRTFCFRLRDELLFALFEVSLRGPVQGELCVESF
jgi:hypothetical protein